DGYHRRRDRSGVRVALGRRPAGYRLACSRSQADRSAKEGFAAMANLPRNAFAPFLVSLTRLAFGVASVRSHSPARRPAPRTYELSPRRIEARIDARGHDRIALQATAPPPAFQVTVQLVDPLTNR